jgi:spore coat protein U-like protein
MRRAVWLAPCALSLLASMPCRAACTVTTTSVAFNPYDVFNTLNNDITGTLTVRCNPGQAYALSLSTGSGTYASRKLVNGPYLLSYNLYTDAARTTIWGDGTAGTSTVSGNAKNATHTVYGRIPARQNARMGSGYTDTIVVTVTY